MDEYKNGHLTERMLLQNGWSSGSHHHNPNLFLHKMFQMFTLYNSGSQTNSKIKVYLSDFEGK